ncbi:MAG TPA: hypothetical protein VKT80_01170, partial [Chloroflexota bacterium]|nr:hypothetical protein [Chloroflexota bacterium]
IVLKCSYLSLSVAGMILALFGGGCASGNSSQLTVTCDRSQEFTQRFDVAYCSQDSDGNTDVVLMDEAARKALDGEPVRAPVRQVMHIRVLWKPSRDLHADHNSASNATIHWYVIGTSPKCAGVLEYAGTAVVVLEAGDGSTDLSIRTATFKVVASRGSIRDPLGPATLHGSIRARESLERVRLALKSVTTAIVSADNSGTDATARNAPELPSSSVR